METGIESGAGIWGYLFLTAGRGLPGPAAGVAVSAYWAMMFAGGSSSARSPSVSGRPASWPWRSRACRWEPR